MLSLIRVVLSYPVSGRHILRSPRFAPNLLDMGQFMARQEAQYRPPQLMPLTLRVFRFTSRFNPLALLIAASVLLIWYLATRDEAASFVVASPEKVLLKFGETLANGTLLTNLVTTLLEIGIGLTLGVSAACLLGYGIARNRLIEQAVGPYAVGFQAVPIVAIAPVLIRLFGPGLWSNSVVCALIVFFPMLITTAVAIRNVDPTLHDLMRVLTATRRQTFIRLEIPAAMPVLFGGFKISTTLAVIGAVVGEAVSAQAGLGYVIYAARYMYDTSLILVGVFTLTALALTLYELVTRVERYVLRWQRVKQ
jgi:NitT/TauT family transport system permease protein